MKIIEMEEHQQLGTLCKVLYDKLLNNVIELQKIKGTDRELLKHYRKSLDAISLLRNHMEEILYNDYPLIREVEIYYGDIKDEANRNK